MEKNIKLLINSKIKCSKKIAYLNDELRFNELQYDCISEKIIKQKQENYDDKEIRKLEVMLKKYIIKINNIKKRIQELLEILPILEEEILECYEIETEYCYYDKKLKEDKNEKVKIS